MASEVKVVLPKRWSFWLERRDGTDVLVHSRDYYICCRPASAVEAWALKKLGMVKEYKRGK